MFSQSILLSFQLALSLSIVKTKPSAVPLDEWLNAIKTILTGPSTDVDALKVITKTFPQAEAIEARLESNVSSSPWKLPKLLCAMQNLQHRQEKPELDTLQLTQELVKTACLTKSSITLFLDARVRNEHRSSQRVMDSLRRDLGRLLSVVGSVMVLLLSAFTKLAAVIKNANKCDQDSAGFATRAIADLLETILGAIQEVTHSIARQMIRTGVGSNLIDSRQNDIQHRSTVGETLQRDKENGEIGKPSSFSYTLVSAWVPVFLKPLAGAFVSLTKSPPTATKNIPSLKEQLRLSLVGLLLVQCGRLIKSLCLRPLFEQPIASRDTTTSSKEQPSRKSAPIRGSKGIRIQVPSKNSDSQSQQQQDDNITKLASRIEGHILISLLKLLHYDLPHTEESSKLSSAESSKFQETKKTFQRTLISGISEHETSEEIPPGARLTDYLQTHPAGYDNMVREAESLFKDDKDFGLDSTGDSSTIPFVDRMWDLCGWEMLEEGWDQTAGYVTADDANRVLLQEEIETEDEEL